MWPTWPARGPKGQASERGKPMDHEGTRVAEWRAGQHSSASGEDQSARCYAVVRDNVETV